MTHRIRTLLSVALVLSLALAVAGPQTRVSAAAPAPQLRIVGPAGEDPPVVNERKKLKMRVVDETGADVAVTAWRTGSPAVAKVTKKGVLKGELYGFATVTAETGRGEAATTVVVARVTRRHGSMGDGDTKSDTAGRIYLTSPDEQVIYRSDGVRDEIFAGTKGEAGYQDGTGQNARFHYPTGLGVDVSTNGGLYVADTDNHCIRKVGFDGRTSVATGVPQFPGRIDADVVPAAEAVFDSPKGVAAFGQSLFVADTRNHALYYLNGRGDAVSLLAGQPGVLGFRNGLFREASFNLPSGLAINTEGNLLAVADTGNNAVRLARIEPGGSPYLGRVSTAGVTSKAGRGTPAAGFVFSAPTSVAFDSAQNVCVVDSQGASVITRAADGTEALVQLAQPGSLGRPASIVVSGTRAIIADADASSPGVAIAVVEVGAPRITSVTPSRVPEGSSIGEVVIEGENFPPEARIVVDGRLIENVRVESASRIVIDLPELSRGSRLLSVLTRGGVAQFEIDIVPPALETLEPGEITTYAGAMVPALGDGGLATNPRAVVGSAADVSVDGLGNVYVTSAETHRVRRIDSQSGIIATYLGTGRPEVGADGSPAVAFGLKSPLSSAAGPNGALYVADSGHNRVVRVDPVTTMVESVLGNAITSGEGHDGTLSGPAFLLSAPSAVAFDTEGNLFVADGGNKRVVRVDSDTSIVQVVAGGGLDDRLPIEGEQATASRYFVTSIDIDELGALLLVVAGGPQSSSSGVVRVDLDGRVRVIDEVGRAAAFGNGNAIYYSSGNSVFRLDERTNETTRVAGGGLQGVVGDEGNATRAYVDAVDLAVDGVGNLLLADRFHERIRIVYRADGRISTIAGVIGLSRAGDGGFRTSASLTGVGDLAWCSDLGLVLADGGSGGVRFVDRGSDILSTPIGSGSRELEAVVREGDLAKEAAVVPNAVGVDSQSRILFSDVRNARGPCTVWRVERTGRLRRLAGPGVDVSDGIPARRAYVGTVTEIFWRPDESALVLDVRSRRVRLIDHSTQTIRTVAGSLSAAGAYTGEGGLATEATFASPSAMTLARNGDLYVADVGRIVRIDSRGIIRTISGGDEPGIPEDGKPISLARYSYIASMVFDDSGRLFVADQGSRMVVSLDFASGLVTRIAGSPTSFGNDGDGGPATDAGIGAPHALVFDELGNLYVATSGDSGPYVVRVIKAFDRLICRKHRRME